MREEGYYFVKWHDFEDRIPGYEWTIARWNINYNTPNKSYWSTSGSEWTYYEEEVPFCKIGDKIELPKD